jgi:hypothetical protein
VTLDTQEKRIQLSNNMIDFDHYEIRQDAQLWHSNDLPQYTMPNTFIWTPGSFSTLTIRGVTKAGATSPEVVISAND